MPDTDPFASAPIPVGGPAGAPTSASGDIAAPVDHGTARVRAEVEARIIGEHEPSAARVGRFQLLERVGDGGMGVVFAAYDPQLDRRVAVKLLRRTEAADASLRARILREAQAMAKLSHPNVAQVYEVGEHHGSTFIAMEFVRGQTLRAWHKGRDWPEILQVYVQAARGLGAAHEVGLVHRDFKPENAMVGDDGRVRVLDFGLARAGEKITAADLELDTQLPSPGEDAPGIPLTRDGAVMGTPVYMAPEQLLGEPTDARTDQFGFCVALWEALYGERPFAGRSRAELIANVTRGRVRPAPRATKAPPWVRAVLERGLAVAPSRRYPTMTALLTALAHDPTRRRRRRIAIAASAAVLGLSFVAVEGFRRYQRARAVQACESAGARIDAVWNDEVGQRVRDALLATGVGFASDTADRVVVRLDAQASAWRGHQTEACTQAEIERSWDAESYERASWCLEERRAELESLVGTLHQADASVVRNAIDAAAALASSAPCLDTALLAKRPDVPDASSRQAIAEIRSELAQATLGSDAARFDEALKAVGAARERAVALGWPPLVAEARRREGEILRAAGRFADAEAAASAAYFVAANAGQWEVAAAAALGLITSVGLDQARPLEGRAWGLHADVALALAGDSDGLREGTRLNNLGGVDLLVADYALARERFERALAIREAVLGQDHPTLAASLMNVADVDVALGDFARARALLDRALAATEAAFGSAHPKVGRCLHRVSVAYQAAGEFRQAQLLAERSLRITEAALGPEHPDTAESLSQLADVLVEVGDHARARSLYQRALTIRERVLGSAHPDVANVLALLANVEGLLGNLERSRELHERALAINEATLGPSHPKFADGLNDLASAYSDLGDLDKARELYERALTVREAALGRDHDAVGATLTNLAIVLQQLGQRDSAAPLFERALRIRRQTRGPDSPELAYTLLGLSLVALEQGRGADAIARAQEAVRVRVRANVAPELQSEARLVLAMALWDAPAGDGRDRARAVREATSVRDACRGVAAARPEFVQAEAWLATHAVEH